MKIGIIGKGFVGSAVQFGFSPNTGCDADVKTYDKDPNKSTHSLDDTINGSDFIFLSVPTPSNPDGSVNLDTVNKYIRPNIIENVKNSPDLKFYRDNNITLDYKYYDKNGKFALEISVTPEIYNNK